MPDGFYIDRKLDPVGGAGTWTLITLVSTSNPEQYTHIDSFDDTGMEFVTYRVKAKNALSQESGYTESGVISLVVDSAVALPLEEMN